MKRSIVLWGLVAVVGVAAGAGPPASAQAPEEYVIGIGDVLVVSVWRHPEMDARVVVRSNGSVTFPPVGEITAAGMTPAVLARDLTQRLRDYTRETNQVTVTVEQYNSRGIFVTGQVAGPGRYSFEDMPDIIRLLSQAGGALPSADLSSVSIIRTGDVGPEIIPVDVAAYMRGETTEPLPVLLPGDTIEVPSIVGSGGVSGPDVIYVLGEVNRPGAYPASGGLDVLQALALAGGVTQRAKLDEVAVVIDEGEGQVVAVVDVERMVREGSARVLEAKGGDRVVVPTVEAGLGAKILGGAGVVLDATTSVLNTYLNYLTIDRVLDERDERANSE